MSGSFFSKDGSLSVFPRVGPLPALGVKNIVSRHPSPDLLGHLLGDSGSPMSLEGQGRKALHSGPSSFTKGKTSLGGLEEETGRGVGVAGHEESRRTAFGGLYPWGPAPGQQPKSPDWDPPSPFHVGCKPKGEISPTVLPSFVRVWGKRPPQRMREERTPPAPLLSAAPSK